MCKPNMTTSHLPGVDVVLMDSIVCLAHKRLTRGKIRRRRQRRVARDRRGTTTGAAGTSQQVCRRYRLKADNSRCDLS